LLWSRLTANVLGEVIVTCEPIMDDDFSGNVLNVCRWSIEKPLSGYTGTVRVANQRLEISVGPGAGGMGVVSGCTIIGDFDVQVDYDLLGTPVANLYGARLAGPELGVGPFGEVGVERGRTAVYRTNTLSATPTNPIPTTDTSGSLRLVRVGSTVTGYFRRGGNWTFIASGSARSAPTRINLD